MESEERSMVMLMQGVLKVAMVFLNVKKSECEQFLLTVPVATSVDQAIQLCAEARNLYDRLGRLCRSLEKKGPEDGLMEISLSSSDALKAGRQLLSKEFVAQRSSLTPELLRKAILDLESASAVLEDPEKAGKAPCIIEDQGHGVDPGTTDMWFAGKRLDRGKLLRDYLGRNEKTKAIVKLQEAGGTRPARESVLDEVGEKDMMAWHFRKQQQQKMLEADSEDFTTSPWASSLALKQRLSGLENIRLS